MDRATLLQHLAVAQRHIAQGERHLVKQEILIAELDRDGHDTDEAKKVLATIRQTQTLHLEDRVRILRELDKSR